MCQYAVIDLEMCNVPKGEKRRKLGIKQEMIQIGAVLLNEDLQIVDTFATYVHPEYGFVDTFIENLTGITQSDVENAVSAENALTDLFLWLPENARIVSWSESDKRQITKELEGKNIDLPGFSQYIDRWIDCQATFGEKMSSSRCYKLSEALNIAGIFYDEGEHDALVDAKNTAKLFRKMETEPIMQLSPYIITEENKAFCYNPFSDLMCAFAAD